MNQRRINIDPLSVRSLLLQLRVGGNDLSTATGFVVEVDAKKILISSWHVFAGRDPDTGQPLSPTAGIPDEVRIVHHGPSLGSWHITSEPLLQGDQALWLAHPDGQRMDLAGLELRNLPEAVAIYSFDTNLADVDLVAQPAMPVSIIGFPFGISVAGAWPIWKTGHIATDPDLDYDDRPAFLIDATTRGGMSGSPVVVRLSGGFQTSAGYTLAGGLTTKFLGVYSGRIHDSAEIGRVWRPEVVTQLLTRFR